MAFARPLESAMRLLRPAIIVAALAVLLVAALAFWRQATRTPSLEADLAGLPAVVPVESSGPVRSAKATVIHLLDWHLVPRDQLFPPQERRSMQLLGKDVDRLYRDHLDAVESVQIEHEAILRRLAEKQGKLTVFIGGLTDAEVKAFVLKAQVLAKADAEEIAEAKRMLDEVKAMKQTPAAKATADELADMIAKHRAEVLAQGATMRLIHEGLVEVRAAEDREALEKAKPDEDGIDVVANAEREEQIAKHDP
jgi:hypothetical protein